MTGQRTDEPSSVMAQEQCDALAARIAAVLRDRKKFGEERRRRRLEYERLNGERALARHYKLRDDFRKRSDDPVYVTIMGSNAAV
jgi:hypothetical protein